MNRARMVIVLIMLIMLASTLAGTFLTRGVMAYLPFLQARKGDWTGAYVPPELWINGPGRQRQLWRPWHSRRRRKNSPGRLSALRITKSTRRSRSH